MDFSPEFDLKKRTKPQPWRGTLNRYSQTFRHLWKYLKAIDFCALTTELPRQLSTDSQMPLQSPGCLDAFGFLINSLRHFNPNVHHGEQTSLALHLREIILQVQHWHRELEIVQRLLSA